MEPMGDTQIQYSFLLEYCEDLHTNNWDLEGLSASGKKSDILLECFGQMY